MRYSFADNTWKNDFKYAYSLVANTFCEFTEENGHVVNPYNVKAGCYDYISIVHKDVFEKGAKVSAKCSFDHYGAPLLTFASSLWTDGDGHLRYGDHYEVVAFENGCNVWYITKADEGSERPFKVANCIRLRFPIEDKSIIDMSVEVLDKALRINVNGVDFDLPTPLLSDKLYIGITACEGVNRFYEAALTHGEN